MQIFIQMLRHFLSYKTFDVYYYKICGYCDSKCIKMLQMKKGNDNSLNNKKSINIIYIYILFVYID